MKYNLSLLTILLFSSFTFGQTGRDKGVELYLQGDYDGAISVLQKVVQTDKKDHEAWLYLGMSFVRVKNDKEALKALRKGASTSQNGARYYDQDIKITLKPRVAYTEAALRKQTLGKVRLVAEFGADGKVGAVVPIQSLPDGLTENSITAARSIKFEPASRNGKPVLVIKVIEYNFDPYR